MLSLGGGGGRLVGLVGGSGVVWCGVGVGGGGVGVGRRGREGGERGACGGGGVVWCGVVWCGGGGADGAITKTCLPMSTHACNEFKKRAGASAPPPRLD